MRKIVLAALCVAALAPVQAFALNHGDNLPDGKDCRNGGDRVVARTYAGGASSSGTSAKQENASASPSRLAICVHEGGHTIFYVGGDLQSKDPRVQNTAKTCGAVIVADQPVTSNPEVGGEDWHNPALNEDC